MHKFVITHKPIEWEIPFEHQLVTVNGYKKEGAIDASDTIGELNLNRTFAFYGGVAAILENIKHLPDDDHIAVYTHRSCFSNEFDTRINLAVSENSQNLDNPDHEFRKIITPTEFNTEWKDKLFTEFPEGYDLVVGRPMLLPLSLIEQYARFHHLDDLLFGLSIAVRCGLLNPALASEFLTKPIYLGQFSAKVSFFRNLYEKIWWIAKEIYAKHYVQRSGYQERSINFTLERLCCLYLLEKVYAERIPTICAGLLQIDPNSVYQPGA
jgi:hypothetical protein